MLAAGDFAQGFKLIESLRKTGAFTVGPSRYIAEKLGSPVWQGQTLEGKSVLILSEEGLGDQIMYARFVPMLQELGASVTWICKAPLSRLFSKCLGIRTFPENGTMNIARPDFCIPSSALPACFFPPLTVPPEAPYLRMPPPIVSPGMGIGVVTFGNPNHYNDANRSMPPDTAEDLLSIPGAVNLRPEVTGARDLYDTATIIAGLDLVISVDTSVAHLSAALGKPTWVMLPLSRMDWRWSDGRKSPWYPAARLFRQAREGDWASVVSDVRNALSTER